MTFDDILGNGAQTAFLGAVNVDAPATVVFTPREPTTMPSGITLQGDNAETARGVCAHIEWPSVSAALTVTVYEDKTVFIGEGFCVRNAKGEVLETPQDQFAKQPHFMMECFAWATTFGVTKMVTDMFTNQTAFMETLGWQCVSQGDVISRWELPAADFPVKES